MFWDVDAESTHPLPMTPDSAEKLNRPLTHHRPWSSLHTRLAHPAEMMIMAGFPANLDYQCVSTTELHMLCGNTIVIPLVAKVLSMACWALSWGAEASQQQSPPQPQQLPVCQQQQHQMNGGVSRLTCRRQLCCGEGCVLPGIPEYLAARRGEELQTADEGKASNKKRARSAAKTDRKEAKKAVSAAPADTRNPSGGIPLGESPLGESLWGNPL